MKNGLTLLKDKDAEFHNYILNGGENVSFSSKLLGAVKSGGR
jgi:hypothetical protein